MDRRELLKLIAVLTGASVVGAEFWLTGCKAAPSDAGFTPNSIALLDEIGETIIPATSTPGAKAARIGEFMKIIVNDCYRQNEQEAFINGISEIENVCKKTYNKSLMDCSPQQRHDLLVSLEKEAKAFNEKRDLSDKPNKEALEKANIGVPWNDHKEFIPTPSHYYTLMKQLTLWGFFSSKTGMTETLRHVPVPGSYSGDVPYKKGDKAWAE